MSLRFGSLFAGIGGFDLGFEPVVEWIGRRLVAAA